MKLTSLHNETDKIITIRGVQVMPNTVGRRLHPSAIEEGLMDTPYTKQKGVYYAKKDDTAQSK